MSIIVNPHNQQEELALLTFLDNMKYDYAKDDEMIVLSSQQKQEILDRDKQYEAGGATTYSLDEIITYFNIKE